MDHRLTEAVRVMLGWAPIGRMAETLHRDHAASERRRHRAIEARVASEQAVVVARSATAHAIATSRRSERVLASYRRATQVQREAHH